MTEAVETISSEVQNQRSADSWLARAQLRDAAFLAFATTIPTLFYTRGLGFYFDDHFFLGLMSTSRDQSLGGLYDALTADPKSELRPVEYFGLALMFRLFGTDALPYHIVLAALVPLCALALYMALSRLRLPRYLTVTVPLLFAVAPHYSSDKFWPDAYSPTLALALFAASLYAGLRATSTSGARRWAWLGLATTAMLASVFMYEIALPLFALIVVYHGVRARRDGGAWRSTATALTVVLAAAVIVKIFAAADLGDESSYSIGYEGGFLHHMGYIVSGAVKVNFGTYGIGLPYVVGWITLNHLTWEAVAAGLLVGLSAFVYLARGAGSLRLPEKPTTWRGRPTWQYLAAAGLGVVAAGYGMFVVTTKIFFTSAGVDNRVNIIAAIGMVLIALALILRALALFATQHRQTVFALLVAVLAAIGAFVTTTIGSYWKEAAARQHDVLAGLSAALPSDPPRETVILDGTCPEVGPAIVFSAEDLTGALQTIYRDTKVEGVVATPNVRLGRSDLVITTQIYNYTVRQSFRYDRRLAVYDSRTRRLHPLNSRGAASRYFRSKPRAQCPRQRTFAWGLPTSRYSPFK